MRYASGIRIAAAAGILIGSLALFGCPRNPEVAKAGPTPTGPGAAAVAPAPSATGEAVAPGKQEGDIAVSRRTPPTEEAIASKPAAPPPGASALPAGALKDVFFEYDQAAIPTGQLAALNENARWLKTNGKVKIMIEGHCDERGTTEYNLALGERRAKGVRDYLVSAGVAADRLGTISYGKERPFVPGHDESAWKQNRRVHFAPAAP